MPDCIIKYKNLISYNKFDKTVAYRCIKNMQVHGIFLHEYCNILTYIRHGNTRVGPQAMDSLNYYYNKGTNQLNHVSDGVPWANYPNDLNNETANNYRYNKIGQLEADDSGRIDTIIWTVYGKVQEIIFANIVNDSSTALVYKYDPLGNRIEKVRIRSPFCFSPPCIVQPPAYDTTRYIRDAQGNILAIYYQRHSNVAL